MRLLSATAAALAAMAAPAAAERYAATQLRIDHAAALVSVIPENRADLDVTIAPGGRLPTPGLRLEGQTLVIDGGLENRFRGCTSLAGGRDQVRIAGIGNVARDELPRTLDYRAGGAVYSTIGASAGGRVMLNGCGDATLETASGDLDLVVNGSGNAQAARVGGALVANVNGSGSLRLDGVERNAALRVNGSGDVTIGDIRGAADARVNGSGRVRASAIGAGADLRIAGSGDVQANAVRGPLTVRVNGSGRVGVESMEGPLADLRLSSSGSVTVRGGHAERLVAHSSGSGGVQFGGAAGSSDLEVRGSGSVRVHDAGRIERMIDSGSGSIRVGG